MNKSVIWLRPSFFLLITAGFFMPFFQVSCSGQKIVEVSGYELAVGTKINVPDFKHMDTDKPEEQEIQNPFVAGALVFSIIGLLACFSKKTNLRQLLITTNIIQLGLLIYFAVVLFGKIADVGKTPLLSIQLGYGYWICIIGGLVSLIFNFQHEDEPDVPPKNEIGNAEKKGWSA